MYSSTMENNSFNETASLTPIGRKSKYLKFIQILPTRTCLHVVQGLATQLVTPDKKLDYENPMSVFF